MPRPDPRRERIRALGETICGPVVLRSVGIIGLTGAIIALVAINPLKLDGSREAEPISAVVLQPTVAATWGSSIAFTGSVPSETEARPVRTIDPAELVPSVPAPDAPRSPDTAAASDPADKKGPRMVSVDRAAGQQAASAGRAEAAPEAPAAPRVAWAPSQATASTERVQAADTGSADAPQTAASPSLVALVAAPADPAGALEAANEEALSAVPLPKPRPDEVPKIVKTKARSKATTPTAGALPDPPDCGNLHAYWRYTDRSKGLRQWYCR